MRNKGTHSPAIRLYCLLQILAELAWLISNVLVVSHRIFTQTEKTDSTSSAQGVSGTSSRPVTPPPAPQPVDLSPRGQPTPLSASPPPTTYASLAKSWASIAAEGGESAATPSSHGTGGFPSVSVNAGASGNGNPAPASNGGWGLPDATVASSGGESSFTSPKLLSPGVGTGGMQGSSRPSSASSKVCCSVARDELGTALAPVQ